MATNLFKQDFNVSREDREQLNRHKGICVWFIGLSGSGKSTISNAFESFLFQKNIRTYTLDGDNIRMGINKDLRFSAADRSENLRRIAEIAKLFTDAGTVVLSSFITPLASDREHIRAILGDDYVEVFVNCPLEVCEARDVKGLYAKARRGEIANFTGISAPFEEPDTPDLKLPSHELDLTDSVQLLWNELQPKLNIQ